MYSVPGMPEPMVTPICGGPPRSWAARRTRSPSATRTSTAAIAGTIGPRRDGGGGAGVATVVSGGAGAQLARHARPGRTGRGRGGEMLGGARSQELEGRRGPVLAGWVRQPVAVGDHAPVALVADHGRVGTEHVAVAEPGAVE